MKIDMRDAFFERLVEVAKLDNRIVFLSADHGAFALKEFEDTMPDRYINIGISEQSMVGVAAGLAASGKIVFAYGISPFVSLRVMEQLTLDVAAMQLPVNIVSVGAGFTYSTDGPTHHGLQDLPAVLTIPNLTVLNSSDPINTRAFVDLAVSSGKPHYIRIEKGVFPSLKLHREFSVEGGFSIVKEEGSVFLISTGSVIHELIGVVSEIEQYLGNKTTIVDLFMPHVVESESFLKYISKASSLYTIEESYASNGIGNLIGSILSRKSINIPFKSISPEKIYYYSSGDREYLRRISEVDSASLLKNFK